MKNHILCLIALCTFLQGAIAQEFQFAFFTDMHIHSDSTLNLVKQRLLKTKPEVDFFLLGGDNVDIDNQKPETLAQATARYQQLKSIFEAEKIKFYPTIGNHDHLPRGNSSASDSLYVVLFEKTYYAYEHKGVQFIILNSTNRKDGKYIIDTEQVKWLESILQSTDKAKPIVVSTHVPFLSVYYPVLTGKYTDADTFTNQKAVFDLFKHHNLKLVLQGHMHLYEEIKVKDVTFITAGAVSGNWWNGDYEGTSPGHLIVRYKNGEFSWNYKL